MSVLVAGFGNVFFSDDGLAAAVLALLHDTELGPNTAVRDFGTGGMYLALEMLAGYERVIIVDAVSRDAPAGTAFALDCTADEVDVHSVADPHAMSIGSVLALYRSMREQLGVENNPQIVVVGCVPQNLDEGMNLSEPVRAALPACADLVRKYARQDAVIGADA